jgi:hypothetical protein
MLIFNFGLGILIEFAQIGSLKLLVNVAIKNESQLLGPESPGSFLEIELTQYAPREIPAFGSWIIYEEKPFSSIDQLVAILPELLLYLMFSVVVAKIRENTINDVQPPPITLRDIVSFGIIPVFRIPSRVLPIHNSGQSSIVHDYVAHVEIPVSEDNSVFGLMKDIWYGGAPQNIVEFNFIRERPNEITSNLIIWQ